MDQSLEFRANQIKQRCLSASPRFYSLLLSIAMILRMMHSRYYVALRSTLMLKNTKPDRFFILLKMALASQCFSRIRKDWYSMGITQHCFMDMEDLISA